MIKCLDVLVVANSNGVMGRQPIEAQALGIPVVATRGHSGNSSVLVDGLGGYVIKSPISQEELVDKVDYLINHTEKCIEFAKNGRLHASQKFDPQTNMNKIESIYKKLLKF